MSCLRDVGQLQHPRLEGLASRVATAFLFQEQPLGASLGGVISDRVVRSIVFL